MLLICVPTSKGAIVNGDFEDNADLSGAIASAPLTGWSPTPAGTAIVIGRDPFFQNSNFRSLVSAGGGTTGGSISALFLNDQGVPAPANSMASITQNITTTPGQFYDIRLWVANLSTTITGAGDPSARENLFSVMWNGSAINLSAVDPVHFAVPNPSNPNAVELAGNSGTYVLAADSAWTLVVIPNQAAALTGLTTTLTISAQNNNNATAVDAVDVTPEPSSIVLLIAGAAFAGTRRRRQQRAA